MRDDERRVLCDAEVFLWDGEAAWHFARLPQDAAEEVRLMSGPPRGFGSVRVRVRLGATTWDTSVFPDKASGSFVLPVKKQVRSAEGVAAGDVVRLDLLVEPQREGNA